MQPKICVLKTDGTNCDAETVYALELAGGRIEVVHINELRFKQRRLADYAALVIPGGFSYGDDIASGRVLANELIAYFRDELQAFIEAGRPVLGICNGFQVLVRAGVLPFRSLGRMQVSLAVSTKGQFDCRWVELTPASRQVACIFLAGIPPTFMLPVANCEGRVTGGASVVERLERQGLVQLRYAVGEALNGSVNGIAALSDPSGLVLGMMPHPERNVRRTDHPNWRREECSTHEPAGLLLFRNAVAFARSA